MPDRRIKNTVIKLLAELGAACTKYHAAAVARYFMYCNSGGCIRRSA
jgi:hypothetical protein